MHATTQKLQKTSKEIVQLFCNLVAGVLCALVASQFDALLSQVVVIAMFIPLVLTLSESVSMQSMTLLFPFLHGKGVAWKTIFRRLGKDLRCTLLMGALMAVVVGLISLLFPEGLGSAALSIGVSIALAMTGSTLFGVLIPSLLHAVDWDPKLAAGPVILMFVDVFATSIYLLTAYFLI